MKYIIKNITSFVKKEKAIFMLVLLCVITSSFVIIFSYGLYKNYNRVKFEEENKLNEFYAVFNNSETAFASKGELKRILLNFSDELNEAVDMYYPVLICEEPKDSGEEEMIGIRFCIKNGDILPCTIFKDNLVTQGWMWSGRYFSEQEEKNGERVALIFVNDYGGIGEFSKKLMIDDETALFQGNEYKIIGSQMFEEFIVPFNCVKDDTLVSFVVFHFKKAVTRSQYNEIKEALEKNFPNVVEVQDLDIPEIENYYFYNTIIMISVLIAVLAAINFAFLYKYILSKRIKALAVLRICGCTKQQALGMFIGECMIIVVPVLALTTLAYDKLLLPKLGQYFEYIKSVYSPKLYLLISAIYIIITFIVLLVMINFGFLNKEIVEAKGE